MFDEEIAIGDYIVKYDGPCTAFVCWHEEELGKPKDPESVIAKLNEFVALLKSKFPKTSDIELRDINGTDHYIEVDWSEKEHDWKDHNREFNRRVVVPLKRVLEEKE